MVICARVIEPATPQEAPAGDLTRVLVPSAIGTLGLSYRDRVVVGIDIVPKGRRRKLFKPLKNHRRSDFLDEALGWLSEYFAGTRRSLPLQLSLKDHELDEFTLRVYVETLQIPYGETVSYQKLAISSGQSGAYRRIRSALMANPIPILIPCHRVTPQKRGVGTYIGGEKKKKWLISMEARRTVGSL